MHRPALAAAVLSAALLSAGCGTGLQAQTYKARNAAEGTNATAGDLLLRNLGVDSVPGAAGADGTTVSAVTGVIVNSGTEADALVSATSPAAGSIQLVTTSGDPSLPIPAGGSTGAGWSLRLDALTAPLKPGAYITVTLQFAKAPRTTVQVPVRAGKGTLVDREPLQDPYGEKK